MPSSTSPLRWIGSNHKIRAAVGGESSPWWGCLFLCCVLHFYFNSYVENQWGEICTYLKITISFPPEPIAVKLLRLFFPNVHRRFWREKKNWTDRLVPRGDLVLQRNKEICTTFLHLLLRPSRLVGCHFAWLLNPTLSSRLHPVTPLVTPLLFGWFVALPRDSAFCTNVVVLPLVTLLPPVHLRLSFVKALGIVCRRSRLFPQSGSGVSLNIEAGSAFSCCVSIQKVSGRTDGWTELIWGHGLWVSLLN